MVSCSRNGCERSCVGPHETVAFASRTIRSVPTDKKEKLFDERAMVEWAHAKDVRRSCVNPRGSGIREHTFRAQRRMMRRMHRKGRKVV